MTAAIAHAHAPWPRAAAVPPWRSAQDAEGAAGLQWKLERNCAMSPAQLFGIYLALAAVSLAIALAFAWQGAAPVLAFAAVEQVLVGVALLVYARHAGDHERIALAGGALSVVHHKGRDTERVQFRAAWVRVEPAAGDGSLIEISGDGQRVRVGRYLRPEWRLALAQELRAALRMHTLISDLEQR